jgi:hypothetical protein
VLGFTLINGLTLIIIIGLIETFKTCSNYSK